MGLLITAHGSAGTFRMRDHIHILISIHRCLRYLYFLANKECVEPKMKHLLLYRKRSILLTHYSLYHGRQATHKYFKSKTALIQYIKGAICIGHLLSVSSWVCWRTQPWYHLAKGYTDPSRYGKKENLSSLHILVMRTLLYSIRRSLTEDLKYQPNLLQKTRKTQVNVQRYVFKYPKNWWTSLGGTDVYSSH
jgi:hypothetical protein